MSNKAAKIGSRMLLKPSNKDGALASFTRYLSLAAVLPISTLIGYGLGYGLDYLFGTHFLYIVFLLFGVASGFLEVIREVQREDSSPKT